MRGGNAAKDARRQCCVLFCFGGDKVNESFAFHGYSMNNQIMCVVNGDDILQVDYMTGQQKPIGKTAAAYSELEQTTTEYYNKLVELGVIVPPKDPQEAMAEMQKTMQDMAALIQNLSNEVKELKKNGSESNFVVCGENVSQCKPERSVPESRTNDSGDA